jgi:DNA repair ATPase RecN
MLNKDITTFPNPDTFIKEINNISNRFPTILDDFLKSYKMTHSVPDNSEYQYIYENNKTYMYEYKQELTKFKKKINNSVSDINAFLSNINTQIQLEKQINRKYTKELHIIQNQENATNELIHDYTNIYKMHYLKNWGLFISIFVVGLANYSLYKAKI